MTRLEILKKEKVKMCNGCYNSCYNDDRRFAEYNEYCWSLDSATIVKAFKLCVHTRPDDIGKVKYEKNLSCWYSLNKRLHLKMES